MNMFAYLSINTTVHCQNKILAPNKTLWHCAETTGCVEPLLDTILPSSARK